MKSLWKRLAQCAFTVSIGAGLTAELVAQDSDQAGIVRISKPRTNDVAGAHVIPVCATMAGEACIVPPGRCAPLPLVPGPTPCASSMGQMNSCPMDVSGGYYSGFPRGRRGDWRQCDWQYNNTWGSGLRARTQAMSISMEHSYGRYDDCNPALCNHDASGRAMLDYFRCKFGYFIPSGGGGQGIPWVGHYSRVYPVNPYYTDSRDGQAWGAQGYGVPMAVPLAPVVAHTYNYGWGVPSSRLTPVSHPAY